MKLFKNNFDAVVELAYADSWWKMHIEKARINVPENAAILRDSDSRYSLYGKINAAGIQELEASGIEARINPLSSGTRTIITRDGRIFLNNSIECRNDYIQNCLPAAIYHAKSMFAETFFTRLREKLKR